jgi:hypothetical protein
VRTREADEPCSEGARREAILGLAQRSAGDLGASEDGVLQDGQPNDREPLARPYVARSEQRRIASWYQYVSFQV